MTKATVGVLLCLASVPLTAAEPVRELDPLALWSSGERDKAVERFIATDWTKPDVFPAGSVFRMTETQYKAAPAARRKKVDDSIRKQASELRALVGEVFDRGTKARAKDDKNGATRALEAARACGKHISTQPDALAVLKLVGTAIEKRAGEHLAAAK